MSQNHADVTPVGNTGSNSKSSESTVELIGLDYLVCTGRFFTKAAMDAAIDFAIAGFIPDQAIRNPGRPHFRGIPWHNSGGSITGVQFCWNSPDDVASGSNPDESDDIPEYHLWLSMPGGFLKRLGVEKQLNLLAGLVGTYGMKPTRLDLAVDDNVCRLNPSDIQQLWRENKIAGVKKIEYIESQSDGGKPSRTVYLGSKSSDKKLRVYDTLELHKKEAVRFELEMRDERAFEFARQFMGIYGTDGWLQTAFAMIPAVIFGAVDMVTFSVRNRTNPDGKKYSRAEVDANTELRDVRYQELIDETSGGTLKISCGRTPPTLEKTIRWIEKQVAPTLAVFREAFGKFHFKQWIDAKAEGSISRHNAKHKAQIAILKQEGFGVQG